MKIIKTAAAMAILVSISGIAHAQDEGAYGVIGATTYEFDTFGLNAKLGYNFNKYFGVEADGILGLTSVTETFGTSKIEAKVDYTIAAFGVARLPVSEQVDIFARGGYHQTGLSLKALGTTTSGDIDGFAVGGGVQYNFSENSGIRAEYTYMDGGFSDFNAVSVGYVRKF